MYWLLAREVLYLQNKITRNERNAFTVAIADKSGKEHSEIVMPDLYFYRSPDEMKKEEEAMTHRPEPEEAPMPMMEAEVSFIFTLIALLSGYAGEAIAARHASYSRLGRRIGMESTSTS